MVKGNQKEQSFKQKTSSWGPDNTSNNSFSNVVKEYNAYKRNHKMMHCLLKGKGLGQVLSVITAI